MKMTKKVLFGAAILAMVFGFASCKNEDDDPEGAIKKVNSNNYTVEYDNAGGYGTEEDKKSTDATVKTGVYRAWARTGLKHLGALTKITLQSGKGYDGVASNAGKNSGVMGFAWDLQDTDSDTTKETFNVVGIRNWGGTLYAYVSRYYNVSDKQKNNFGAEALSKKGSAATIEKSDVEGKTVEWDISEGFKSLGITPNGATVDVWVDVAIRPSNDELNADTKFEKYGTYSTRQNSSYPNTVGSWTVAIYDTDPTKITTGTALTPKAYYVIPAATATTLGSGYNEDGTNGATKFSSSGIQRKQAVYANIYKGAKLSGAWNYLATYLLADVVADAE